MDFGRVEAERLGGVNFTLPPDVAGFTAADVRRGPGAASPRVYVACPIWNHPGLVGLIYPETAKPADYLRHYARSFPAIELNTTYYGVNPENIRRWRDMVPPGFKFAPKLTKEISHDRALVDVEEAVLKFCDAVQDFGDHLGPLFLLLPAGFAPDRIGVLARFLERFPRGVELSIELRHPAWFSGAPARDVFTLFRETGTVAVLTDVAGRRDVAHMRLTSPTAVIRFVGNRLHPTDFSRIDAWADRLAAWISDGLECVYFFLHQPEEHLNVDVADHLIAALNERAGLNLPFPERIAKQQELF